MPKNKVIVNDILLFLNFYFMPKKKGTKKYGEAAGKSVKKAMHKMKKGKLVSGKSGKKVKSRKQAVAIGLSEARKKGAKVPAPPKKK